MLRANFIEGFTFEVQLMAVLKKFFGHIPASFANCFSKFNNKACLFFFADKIREYLFNNYFKFIAKTMPSITKFTAIYLFSFCKSSAKAFNKTFHKFQIGVDNCESRGVIIMLSNRGSIFFRKWGHTFNAYTPFSIDYSREISFRNLWRVHRLLSLLVQRTINKEITQRERLNPRAPKGEAIV